LSNVLPQPAGLVQTSYRGAFNTNDLWAHKWTALYKLGYLQGTWFAPDVVEPPDCAPVELAITRDGGNVIISWTGAAECSYQLQSATDLGVNPVVWTSEGVFNGAGPHQHTTAAGGTLKVFRVISE
jgi:hypothetical protein